MASQTKVDSARSSSSRRAAEKRGEPGSHSADTSASGTFETRHDSERVPRGDDLDDPADDTASHKTIDDASEEPAPRADSDFAAAGASEDDEDVSLDELMMSDSADEEEEEEEATDIHPGLSEAVLAESLGALPRPPAVVAGRPAAVVVPEPEQDDAPLAGSRAEAAVSEGPGQIEDAAPESEQRSGEEALALEETPGHEDPEEVVIAAEDLPAQGAVESVSAASEQETELSSDPEATLNVGAAESAQLNEEPTRPDASPIESSESSEILDVSPESESEVLSSTAIEAVALEAEQFEAAEPLAVEIELDESVDAAAALAASASERKTVPETLNAKRRDAPLPSFDIPDLDAVSGTRTSAAAPAAAPPRAAAQQVALPPLEEVDEDDDADAVTHMGLPTVPEVANDYPSAAAAHGFQVADPAVAALQSIDTDIARGDSRRATTRVIPRVDPKTLPPKQRAHAPAGAPLVARLSAAARDVWGLALRYVRPEEIFAGTPRAPSDPLFGGDAGTVRPRLNWMLENVLPPLSLVLFGSGLGAGVIMLVEKDHPEEPAQSQSVQALHDSASAARPPTTLAERARAGDGEALYKITKMPQAERTSALTLALEAGYQSQKLREFHEFAKTLAPASKPLPAASVSRMVDYATSPETLLPAFEEITQWAGPAGPDVLYAVWEKAGGGTRAASLAQQLLYSADQRAKATPALQVALDLRSAASCDDYAKVLPAVLKSGDQRSSATLRALRHNDGCGADGKQDCFACLRDSSLLEDALRAVEKR
jgi:hypothetical protein